MERKIDHEFFIKKLWPKMGSSALMKIAILYLRGARSRRIIRDRTKYSRQLCTEKVGQTRDREEPFTWLPEVLSSYASHNLH